MKSKEKIHKIWSDLIEKNTKDTIKLWSDWHTFDNFYRWALSNGYHDDSILIHLDESNYKNAKPSTLKFIRTAPGLEYKSGQYIYNGENAIEASYRLGSNLDISHFPSHAKMKPSLVDTRIKLGWPIKEAFTLPAGVRLKDVTK